MLNIMDKRKSMAQGSSHVIPQVYDMKSLSMFKVKSHNSKSDNLVQCLSQESNEIDKRVKNLIKNITVNESPTIVIQQLEGNILPKETLFLNAGGVVDENQPDIKEKKISGEGIIFFGTNNKKNYVNSIKLKLANNLEMPYLFFIYYRQGKIYLISI